MKHLILSLLLCSQCYAFDVEDGQKLPTHITYMCDERIEYAFLSAFNAWNYACDNIFTIEKITDGTPTIAVTLVDFLPITPEEGQIVGFTTYFGKGATIQILNPNGMTMAVLLHEVGHALGMAHSKDPESIMFPLQQGAWGLSQDDVDGIRAIYGLSPKTFTFQVIVKKHKAMFIGPVNGCTWDFGDGTGAAGKFAKQKLVHTFKAYGHYKVRMLFNFICESQDIEIIKPISRRNARKSADK